MRVIHVEDSRRFTPLGQQLWGHILKDNKTTSFLKVTPEGLKRLDVSRTDLIYSKWLLDTDTPGTIVGPVPKVAHMWNDKCYQYEQVRNFAPVPQFKLYRNIFAFLKDDYKFSDMYFLTCARSDGGSHCMRVDDTSSLNDVWEMVGDKVNDSLRASLWTYNKKEISYHVVIASRAQIFICEGVDQFNDKDHVSFKAVRHPSIIGWRTQERCRSIIRRIGRQMADTGFRGVCGMDFMINKAEEIFLIEINPRKMGSAVCDSVMLEIKYGISLPVLEHYAAVSARLPIITTKGKVSDYKWSLEIFDGPDWSGPIDYPGVEIEHLRRKEDFTVSYFDKYYDKTKIFCIKGGTHVD